MCGLDYFGPLLTTQRRSTVKVWGVIFRCLATRAVHLDLVHSLDTDAALMAITRFQARRGNVREIWSDNGSNFKAADKELQGCLRELDQAQLTEKLGLDGINWHFNSPADPEAGGVWERQIRTIKETLRVILREQKPSAEVLRTFLCEVEKIMNSTPLFHVPVDVTDEEVLTPFHFLIGRATASYPPGSFNDDDLCLRRRWRYSQRLTDHFWKRWLKEYLPALHRRVKWQQGGRPVRKNDIVIIVDDQHPRGVWPRGIVEEVYHGFDGAARNVLIKTKNGHLRRPVRKVIVLDTFTTSCEGPEC